jgi:hypothetical protein
MTTRMSISLRESGRRETEPDRCLRRTPAVRGALVDAVLGLQRAVGNRATRRLIQRIDDDELSDLLKNKANKKQHDAAKSKYNNNFGLSGQYKNYHGGENWDYWVKKAYDLADLTRLIDELVNTAAAARTTTTSSVSSVSSVITSSPNPPSSPSSALTGVSSLPSSSLVSSPPPSTPVLAQPSPQPSTPVLAQPLPQPLPQPPQPKKKKGKGTPVPLSQVFATSTTTQQTVDELVPGTNTQVQQLIAARPPGATRQVSAPDVRQDTVYYWLTVWLPVETTQGYPRRRRYELEIHHHPVPTSGNYLHVKVRAGTSPQNVLPLTNWLADRGQFNAGVVAWNQANPNRQSTQQF